MDHCLAEFFEGANLVEGDVDNLIGLIEPVIVGDIDIEVAVPISPLHFFQVIEYRLVVPEFFCSFDSARDFNLPPLPQQSLHFPQLSEKPNHFIIGVHRLQCI